MADKVPVNERRRWMAYGVTAALSVVAAHATAQGDTGSASDAPSPGGCTGDKTVWAVTEAGCEAHPGDTLTVFVRRPGLRKIGAFVTVQRSMMGQAAAPNAGDGPRRKAKPVLLPMTLISGDGRAVGSVYTITLPQTCVRNFRWFYSLGAPPDLHPNPLGLDGFAGIAVTC